MKYTVRQRIFTIGAKYDITDTDGNPVYYVESEIISLGRVLHIYDMQGSEAALIEQRLFTFDRKYEGIAKYPAVTRDLSMVMRKDILVGDIEKVFEKRGGKLLESMTLFDVYEGAQIQMGYKSVAYSLAFRAKDRTLEDKDITPIMEKILSDLNEMGIELRK